MNSSTFLKQAAAHGVHPSTCNPQAASDDELYTPIVCSLAQAIQSGTFDSSDDSEPLPEALPESVQKSFHPKTAGFVKTRLEILDDLRYDPATSTTGKQFRIMAIGDELTVGTGGAKDGSASYRMELYDLLQKPTTVYNLLEQRSREAVNPGLRARRTSDIKVKSPH